ncbi:MAG TPA: CRTAC1 family protein [Planctomycetaceae bacterium]
MPSASGTPPVSQVDSSLEGGAGSSRARTAVHFEDVAGAAGVVFTYHNGEESGQFSILESLGGGIAAWDYDADGDLDLFFPGGGRLTTDREVHGLPGALFRNHGAWQFTNETLSAGVGAAPYYSHGATAGDYDGDGFADLLVTGYGGLVLWHNGGDGTLTETTLVAGLTDTLWSTSAAWGDLNNDGSPDLYVAHYVDWSFDHHLVCTAQRADHPRDWCPPIKFGPLPDTLYFSNGDGTFRDGSREAGLRTDGKGLGVVIADLDLDGAPDLYVANDTTPNFLYRNRGAGRLEEVGLVSGVSIDNNGLPNGSMGVDVGDFNMDGLPDLWVSTFERETSALYRNDGNGLFRHVSDSSGITSVGGNFVGWGTAFLDIDNDGDEDVLVANGHVFRYSAYAPLRQLPLVFENLGGRFDHVEAPSGGYLTTPHLGRGMAVGDFDGDGDLDVAISHLNEPVALLENRSESVTKKAHWVAFRLNGTRSARHPVGTVVRVETEQGRQARFVKAGGSYASSNGNLLHFGLGNHADVRQVEVTWPDGAVRRILDCPSGQVHTLIE